MASSPAWRRPFGSPTLIRSLKDDDDDVHDDDGESNELSFRALLETTTTSPLTPVLCASPVMPASSMSSSAASSYSAASHSSASSSQLLKDASAVMESVTKTADSVFLPEAEAPRPPRHQSIQATSDNIDGDTAAAKEKEDIQRLDTPDLLVTLDTKMQICQEMLLEMDTLALQGAAQRLPFDLELSPIKSSTSRARAPSRTSPLRKSFDGATLAVRRNDTASNQMMLLRTAGPSYTTRRGKGRVATVDKALVARNLDEAFSKMAVTCPSPPPPLRFLAFTPSRPKTSPRCKRRPSRAFGALGALVGTAEGIVSETRKGLRALHTSVVDTLVRRPLRAVLNQVGGAMVAIGGRMLLSPTKQ